MNICIITAVANPGCTQRIREALLNHSPRLTTFIISHRISTLSRADQILVLEDGRITASGRHEELINQPGLYRRIYEIQGGSDAPPALQEEVTA